MKKLVWMPHAAHFIGASSCEFRLATYVNGYTVLTVGEYVPRSSGQVEELGFGRTYEMMVFEARRSEEPGHCEACPWCIRCQQRSRDGGYNDAKSAFEGHLALCSKWAGVLPPEVAQ
jgi:hypothetical protein